MFAALVLEYDFPTLNQLWSVNGSVQDGLLLGWVRLMGVVSIAALLLTELFRHLRGRGSSLRGGLSGRLGNLPADQVWKLRSFWLASLVMTGGLAVTLVFVGMSYVRNPTYLQWAQLPFLITCIGGIIAVSWEFIIDLGKLSPRRIWALARFSIKEAIRRKALWSFVVLLVVFLFASWFIRTDKAEEQWKVYVDLIFLITTGLMLVTASVLACFSLPTDIRLQTIHTVVTKPVQRFEIVLGRIIGITLLMTVVLAVITPLSLMYILRGLDPDQREKAQRARMALKGALAFEELNAQGKWVPKASAINVGREWTYRSYVQGGSTQEAIWRYKNLPADLKTRDWVPVEFNFDIFRTSKGGDEYKEGVGVRFTFENKRKWDINRYPEYREAVDPATGLPMNAQQRAKRFGYFELPTAKTVTDYETFTVLFPGAVLEDLDDGDFEIRVSCTSPSQYLGMAKHDLYILHSEGSFYVNFFKGTVGIWFLTVLMTTLGVVFSTHLSALVALMLTWMMMLCGFHWVRSFVYDLARGPNQEDNPGGGPLEAMYRLMARENMLTDLPRGHGTDVIRVGDLMFQYIFKGFHAILPDLRLYERSVFVAEGFNIPGVELLATLVIFIAYLFPFLLAGYYMLNMREVAK